eukprot:1143517-Pelagomonas_calceolata.AAC.16
MLKMIVSAFFFILFQAVKAVVRVIAKRISGGKEEDGSARDSFAYQVIIQEGRGWIIDQVAYTNHLKKFGMTNDAPCESGAHSVTCLLSFLLNVDESQNQQHVERGIVIWVAMAANRAAMSNAPCTASCFDREKDKSWTSRTLILPCPAIPPKFR